MPPRESPSGGGGGGGPVYSGGGGWWDPYWGGSFYCDGFYHYWDGTCYSPYWRRSWRYPRSHAAFVPYDAPDYGDQWTDRGLLAFFPPEPPPLGTPRPPASKETRERVPASERLAEFVSTPFYAPLSTRIERRNLPPKLLQRLESYEQTRAQLLEELRVRIATVAPLELAARTHALADFAAGQTPHIAALEQVAESLRTDLLRGGLVGALNGTGNWNERRRWRLGQGRLDRPREETLAAEFQVVRAAAFYQEGLSPEQRRLLREIAMELQVEAFRQQAPATADHAAPVFFSPETARVRFADDIPPHVAAKLAAFAKARTALKRELRDTLYDQDAAQDRARTTVLKQLAAAQAPRIAALELLAEEIRIDIAQIGRPVHPAPLPALPESLAARVQAYRTEKLALQNELEAEMAVIAARLATQQPDPSRVRSRANGLAAFNSSQRARYERLAAMHNALSGEIAQAMGDRGDGARGRSLETLLANYERNERADSDWQLYADYETAVFLPGLSPEQRRLLFDAGLRALELPLPDGERIP